MDCGANIPVTNLQAGADQALRSFAGKYVQDGEAHLRRVWMKTPKVEISGGPWRQPVLLRKTSKHLMAISLQLVGRKVAAAVTGAFAAYLHLSRS